MKIQIGQKMTGVNKTFTAIDFYSGIGGWSLGLELAGVKVIKSYEWWGPANETHQKNLGATTEQINIRELDLATIPKTVDFVVGSPPCTQFSYSNRGGSGDLKDGLKDIKKFLQVVTKIKPRFWAMENVPRVAKVILNEIKLGGELEEFSQIITDDMVHVYDFSDFGLPQRRKRCIVGNFDADLIQQYKKKCKVKTLGDVLMAFKEKRIKDPNFNLSLSSNEITETEKETTLNWEELRYNREAKTHHTIYNNMAFPDPIVKPVRTVTATCTRVSRESIVIEDAEKFRRLTIRERGCLQGFPINYEFFAPSYSGKIKMIGNAIPPVFTYYLAHAMISTPQEDLVRLEDLPFQIVGALEKAPLTKIDTDGKTYPTNRSFRFAVPNLRFKSGTRFELTNDLGSENWCIRFYFGDSKRILGINLNSELRKVIDLEFIKAFPNTFLEIKKLLVAELSEIDGVELQSVWTNKSRGAHPFELLDQLGATTQKLKNLTVDCEQKVFQDIITKVATIRDKKTDKPISAKKLQHYSREITLGMILGCSFNELNRNF